jgi:ABC-type nitrate/sulfonate/bicarbonate transport system permease component
MATARTLANDDARRILAVRAAIILGILAAWEVLARSGLLFEDVVPSLTAIATALVSLITTAEFYQNLLVTLWELGIALPLGIVAGVLVGLPLGLNPLLRRAYVPYLYYLGSTPKLIFFPVMIMLFGVDTPSKIALAFISCFFPIALSTAEGMRQINPVLVKVGRSFCAPQWAMVRHIYLPAMREPIVTGVRLGFGIAVIATLLAETKLSNQGIGHLIIRAFTNFDMPLMYALLIAVFVLAIVANALLSRLAKPG